MIPISEAVNGLMSRLDQAAASVPCRLEPAGVAGCEAARSWESCSRSGRPACPREAARREREEAARAVERRRELLLEAGVPARHLRLVLDGAANETRAIAAARAFLGDVESVLLVLSGRPGCGKSVAAAWAACQVGPGAVFVDVSRLRRVSAYSEAEMGELERAPLLVIDDLGSEFMDKGGAFLALLDGLINERYSQERKTIITTNLDGAGFKGRYGERIADRIREAGRFIELDGTSMRGRAA